ncbi:uncharacterized protein LOC132276170 [Cornus florida]|uniref:uncharacterized protein LOC132276170 n=1 Tax=Cornus florida TaxID=4283 RepID=UPI00289AD613|nr:uncharacterized protein LOC132276170 [Cornus florida]
MAELQPPEGLINTVTAPPTTTVTTAATSSLLPASADDNNNNHLGLNLAPKRQRRPSVRLGEIGDQSATLSHDSHARRPKPWRFHKDPAALAAKASKTRPLTNLVNGVDCHETLETEDNLDFGNRKPKESKPKRPTKRVRTNWGASKADNGAVGDSREDNDNDDFRDFEPGGSDSPLKEHSSPVHSIDNAVGLNFWAGHSRRLARARVSESWDHHRVQDDRMPDSGKCGTSGERNFGSGSERGPNRWFLDDGVRSWLIGLGLGRYAPAFEIHEVDEEVLPLLTLEDLKDMGINAVGSRRKMYTAIQKLQKGFS